MNKLQSLIIFVYYLNNALKNWNNYFSLKNANPWYTINSHNTSVILWKHKQIIIASELQILGSYSKLNTATKQCIIVMVAVQAYNNAFSVYYTAQDSDFYPLKVSRLIAVRLIHTERHSIKAHVMKSREKVAPCSCVCSFPKTLHFMLFYCN